MRNRSADALLLIPKYLDVSDHRRPSGATATKRCWWTVTAAGTVAWAGTDGQRSRTASADATGRARAATSHDPVATSAGERWTAQS